MNRKDRNEQVEFGISLMNIPVEIVILQQVARLKLQQTFPLVPERDINGKIDGVRKQAAISAETERVSQKSNGNRANTNRTIT
jgi:hypothetical protein